MRVLLSSFAFSPTRGSEASVGWQVASRLARCHEVTVLYGDLASGCASLREIETWSSTQAASRHITPIYVAPDQVASTCEALHTLPGLRPLYYWGYHRWQKDALKTARRLHQLQPFDVVHHITYTGYWEPGYLWQLGIPFFWGPVAGGHLMPLNYFPLLGFRGAMTAAVRNLMTRCTMRIRPRIRSAARCAAHIWCVTPALQRTLSTFSAETSLMPETGSPNEGGSLRELQDGEPLRVIWSGRPVPGKALSVMIRAAAKVPSRDRLELHILGPASNRDPETRKAKHLARKLGIDCRIIWHGYLPHPTALAVMSTGHVLAHTSLMEASSTVVMEALSMGMPVICHDTCGMATVVSSDAGIKVAMTSIDDSIHGFAAALQSLLDNPPTVRALSHGAIVRSRQFSWDGKVEEFVRAYTSAVSPLGGNAAGGIPPARVRRKAERTAGKLVGSHL